MKKTNLYTIKPYHSLPCSLEVFIVNGIHAEKSDFGYSKDTKAAKADPYCCKCMKFIKNKYPIKAVLEKYNITREQWKEICSALSEELFVGECGWCE